jgi:hypothetical protein
MDRFPMLEGKPPLPVEVARAIYDHLYVPLHGDRQSFERIAERGGFAYSEIELMAQKIARKPAPAPEPPIPRECDWCGVKWSEHASGRCGKEQPAPEVPVCRCGHGKDHHAYPGEAGTKCAFTAGQIPSVTSCRCQKYEPAPAPENFNPPPGEARPKPDDNARKIGLEDGSTPSRGTNLPPAPGAKDGERIQCFSHPEQSGFDGPPGYLWACPSCAKRLPPTRKKLAQAEKPNSCDLCADSVAQCGQPNRVPACCWDDSDTTRPCPTCAADQAGGGK